MGRIKTDFLFAMPSLTSGVARLVDLGGTYDAYNDSPSPEEADARAMYADWAMVGQDIKDAMERYEAEAPK